ncbi:MAG: sigma 54-interacting transcriptional regulator [Planctomycetota bacterium]
MSDFRILAYRESAVESFPLASGTEWRIGRAVECDIRLNDPSVSRVHLALQRVQDEFHFEDLGGANPILLHGQRVTRGALVPGVPLVVGSTILYLDRMAKTAEVRIQGGDALSGKTRRYLDEGAAGQPDLANLTQPNPSTAELVASFLAVDEEGAPAGSGAASLVDGAMRWLRFRQGTIVAFVGGATYEVVASRSRDGSATMQISRTILDEVRVRRRAFLQPGTASGRNVAVVAVPLGDPVAGALILSHPIPGLTIDDELLRAAATLGQGIWTRLGELRALRTLREQVSRAQFQQSPAHAALTASARLTSVCRELLRAAEHSLPIFLIGEDGTEKEDLARFAHAHSPRTARAFVGFHAGVVPATRAEEELFGSVRASTVVRAGDSSRALLRAQGGMLFLEEPELLPEHVQDRLARVLAAGEITVAAGDHLPLDLRVVAASTEDPSAPRADGRALRPGLSELLTAIRIDVPPLRSAPADVSTLTELILSEMTPSPDGVPRTVSEQALEALLAYTWPGNVRQLRRVLEVAAARAGNRPVQPRDLPTEVREPRSQSAGLLSLAEVERNHIAAILEAVGGVKTRAAEVLGIAPSTLYEKLRRYNLK